MLLQETFALANGVEIPKLGLGTWLIPDDAVVEVVRNAAAIGYRHFDTAQAYGNERGVGEGLRASGLARDETFVTTKLAAECKDYNEAKQRIDGFVETSLKNPKQAKVDLEILMESLDSYARDYDGKFVELRDLAKASVPEVEKAKTKLELEAVLAKIQNKANEIASQPK